jgi:hypothetical protein
VTAFTSTIMQSWQNYIYGLGSFACHSTLTDDEM